MPAMQRFIAQRSIRSLILLLVACLSIPAMAAVLCLGLSILGDRKIEAEKLSLDLARLAAMEHEDALSQARALLSALGRLPDLLGQSPEEVRLFLGRVVADNPRYAYLALARPDGALFSSTASTNPEISFSDRQHFQSALRTRRFAVGRSVLSRITREPVLPFAGPLFTPEGELAGVFLLGLKLDFFEKYFAGLGAPPGSRFLLFDREGTRLFRYPRREISPFGEKLNQPTWEVVATSRNQSGAFLSRDQAGIELIYGFSRFSSGQGPDLDLGVLAGIPAPRFWDQAWPIIAWAFLGLGAVGAAALAIGSFLGRRWVADGLIGLENRVTAISQGGELAPLGEVPGCREVRGLAQAFDRMVESLRLDREGRARAESLIHNLARRIPVGIFLLRLSPDGRHRFEYASDPFWRIHGLEPMACPQDLGVFRTVVHPEERSAFLSGARAAAAALAPIRWDGRILVDGVVRHVHIAADPEPVPEGGSLWNGVILDITEARTAEEARREAERRYGELVRHAPMGIFQSTPQGRYLEANPWLAEMYGYPSPEELLREVRDIGAELYADPADRAALLAALERGPVARAEVRRRRRDGSIIWVALSMRAARNPDGTVARYEGFANDITELKQAQAGLAESEERYRAFFNSAEAVKLILDPQDGTILDANPEAARFYGYPPERLKAMTVFDLNTLPREEVQAEITRAVLDGLNHFYFRHRLATGEEREVEVHTSPGRYGGRVALMSSIHDVTEFRRLQRIKEDVERILRHDLKSPLAGLIHIPRLLQAEGGLTPAQDDLLDLLVSAGRKMLSQINSSLEMHKIESGAYRFRPQPCDPAALLRENAAMLALSLDRSRDRVRIADRTGGRGLNTDPLLLDITLMNLLRNALEAVDPDQAVHAELAVEGEEMVAAISNPGLVPDPIRDSFFEKYATFGKGGGTGLGTYSAAIMTRAMGGSIALEEIPEGWTRVTVRLPLDRPPDPA